MYNLDEKPEYEVNVVPTGEYECTIANAELRTSKTSGKPYIFLDFLIRSDVNQECKNQHVFSNIFKTNVYRRNNKIIRKSTYEALSPADKSQVVITEEYQDNKIRPILLAQDNDEPNRIVKFNSIEEIIQFINQMNLIVGIELKEPDDFHETEWNDVNYRQIARTAHSTRLTKPEPLKININDEDLPF